MIIRSLSLVLCALLAASTVLAARRSEPDLRTLDAVVRAELAATHTPGAAVAVVAGGRVVYAKGHGVASVETGTPVTPDTLFAIASVTKMFTGLAAATLAGRGVVSLDAPVATWISGLGPKTSRLTLGQLLTHTGGLVDQTAPARSRDDAALLEGARGWKDDLLFTEPGEVFSYSNPGFGMAGLALQEASGKPYADLMRELIFEPVGMRRTTFRLATAITYPVAAGHGAGGTAVVRPYQENVLGWPNGGILSSASDMARFAAAFVGGGAIDGKRALDPQAIALATTGRVTVEGASGDWQQGLGMRVATLRGVRMVEHRGGTEGFGSLLRMAPANGFAVVVLGNRTLVQLDRTAEAAMELFLKLGPKPADPVRTPIPVGADAAMFVGTYTNGRVTLGVAEKDGALALVSDDGSASPLVRVGENRLAIVTPDPEDPPEVTEMLRNLTFLPKSAPRAKYLTFGGRALRRKE